MTDDLVKRLHWHRDFIGTNLWPDGYPFLREVRDRLGDAADRIEALAADRENRLADLRIIKAERDRLREALEQIEITCEEEICVRTAGMSEAALGKSRILPLLQIPRNIARAALKGEAT